MRAVFLIFAWAVAAVGLAAAFAILVLQGHQHQTSYGYQAAAEQGRGTQNGREARAFRAPVTPQANPNPNREEWRSEKDLRAQVDMAQSAFHAVIAAGVSVILALFGVVITGLNLRYIRQTLDENRRSADAAVESARIHGQEFALSRRPWLEVSEVELTSDVWIEAENLRAHFSVKVKVTNHGSTPAFRVCPFFETADMFHGPFESDKVLRRAFEKMGNQQKLGPTIYPAREKWICIDVVTDYRYITGDSWVRPKRPYVIGFINYFSPSRRPSESPLGEPFYTSLDFYIGHRGSANGNIPREGDLFPRDEMVAARLDKTDWGT